MDLAAFMSCEPIKRKIISAGTTQQNIALQRNNADPKHKLDQKTTSRKRYAVEFVANFKDEIWKVCSKCVLANNLQITLHVISNIRQNVPIIFHTTIIEKRFEELRRAHRKERADQNGDSIYTRYNLGFKEATHLPIEKCRQEILQKIRQNTVTVLTGSTGCGMYYYMHRESYFWLKLSSNMHTNSI